MTKLELKQENKRLRDTVHTQQVQINTMNKIFDKISFLRDLRPLHQLAV